MMAVMTVMTVLALALALLPLGLGAGPPQHQPGLRAAASSSAEHGQISHRIFLHRPGHTVYYLGLGSSRLCRASDSEFSEEFWRAVIVIHIC